MGEWVSPRTCRHIARRMMHLPAIESEEVKSSYDEWLIMKLCMYVVCMCGIERYIINYTS